ncbi:MAG: tyrosine-type recombinase/integrase [Paracoccaceae bacterium]
MGIRQRGPSWQASITASGKRFRKDFKERADAEAWIEKMKAKAERGEIDNPAPLPDVVPTLDQLLDTISRSRWSGLKSAHDLIARGRAVVDLIGPERLASTLNKGDADLVKSHFKARGNSPATINRKLAALSVLVAEAFERDLLPRKFTVGMLREPKGRIRFISPAEEAAMIDAAGKLGMEGLADYIAVSLDTGFRQGEVMRIRAKDCGRDNLWTYDTKNGQSREVPLTRRAASILERRAQGFDPDDLVFPMSILTLHYAWAKVRAKAGIKDRTVIPHTLRHTFVTRLLHRGVDIKTVMELAGHQKIETTQRYAQTSPERKVAAIEPLLIGK